MAKGFGIALLLFHHLFYNADRVAAGGEYFAIIPYPVVQRLALCARVCVYVFAFISAYGLTVQFESKGSQYPIRFVAKHWLSLMQSFWPVYFIVFFARTLFVSNPNPLAVYEGEGFAKLSMLLDFFGWSDLFGTHLILGAWWYMCFAQLLIILVPFISKVCRFLSWYSLPLIFVSTFLIPSSIDSPYGGNYCMYAFVAFLGALFAQNQTFGQLYSTLSEKPRGTRLLILILLSFISVTLLLLNQKLSDTLDSWQIRGLLNGVSAVIICYLAGRISTNSFVGRAVSFCGVYSGAMFMFHPFLFSYVPRLIYWPGEALLCYVVFFLLSLGFSIAVTAIRKITRYDLAFSKLRLAFDKHVNA